MKTTRFPGWPLIVLPWLLILSASCAQDARQERSWQALGGTLEIVVHAPSEEAAAQSLDSAGQNIDEALAFLDPQFGELAALNAAADDTYYQVESFDLYKLILLGLDWAKASGGAYDPTLQPLLRLHNREGNLPSQTEIDLVLERTGWQRVAVASEAQAVRFRQPRMGLNLEAIGKGYVLDMAARGFSRGANGGLLRLGNNFYAWKQPNDAPQWSVSIPDPRHDGRFLGTIPLKDRGLSIAGHPEEQAGRWFDPRTGNRAASDVSVAVALADTGADADAVVTALFVLGSTASGELLGRTRRVESILLIEGNGPAYLLVSASLQGRFQIDPELEAELEGRVRYLLPPSEL